MHAIAYGSSSLSVLMSILLFLRLRSPLGMMVLFPKLAAGALSPLWGISGLLGAILGWLSGAPLAIVGGLIGMACMTWYFWKAVARNNDFDLAFGSDWQKRIPVEHRTGMLRHHWTPYMLDPQTEPRWQRDLAFCTIPSTSRQLLCDIWQPPAGITPTGMALIFFHGSGWYLFDKDMGTRPWFRHLAAQGYVIMDVAYRLCPEVDMFDMAGDIKRAVAWMKANSGSYGVNPERIILGGGSAGGHLSMLAAYAPQHPRLTPEELNGNDLSVRGVIALYGPCDLFAVYTHTNQQKIAGKPKIKIGDVIPKGKKNIQDAGRLDIVLGGLPNEIPDVYQATSPINHVHSGCPPTLLIQGQDDVITPVSATRALYEKLQAVGVPAVNVIFPCTEHAFDLILPRFSPSSQSALYSVERFMALLN